ncbi:hypothetical protein DSCO28_44880 [Desulfosarcina ovata subsp. sediminis]|uniref:Uncharacterized protein n=1 Tax=Desulfosarcina ovata subsp. sediminis TaxID=885957 RepID=A0A5K7ZUL7_9BACT|nr:hypothetical protein [Desulfosarcina ovata]BBO83922.1 hypothetical protein DSCO28_44880 [Desulfosarcina ovata subsp. sediminis]
MEEKNIDVAIKNIEDLIIKHQKNARNVLLLVIILGLAVLGCGYATYEFEKYETQYVINDLGRTINEIGTNDKLNDSIFIKENITKLVSELSSRSQGSAGTLYIFLAIFIALFGVSIAVYRFHLTEISRAHHQKFGLMRIRIAAHNFDDPGFGSELSALRAGF